MMPDDNGQNPNTPAGGPTTDNQGVPATTPAPATDGSQMPAADPGMGGQQVPPMGNPAEPVMPETPVDGGTVVNNMPGSNPVEVVNPTTTVVDENGEKPEDGGNQQGPTA